MAKLQEFGLMECGIKKMQRGDCKKLMISSISYSQVHWLVAIIIVHPTREKIFKCLKKIYQVIIRRDSPKSQKSEPFQKKLAKRSITPGALISKTIDTKPKKTLFNTW